MNEITTASGKFYSGMTSSVAKQQDIYKAKFSRDFCDIDKNKDGILSAKEILAERKSEANRKGFWGCINVGVLATDLLFIKKGKKANTLDKLDILIDIPFAFMGLTGVLSSIAIRKENKEIGKQLNCIA